MMRAAPCQGTTGPARPGAPSTWRTPRGVEVLLRMLKRPDSLGTVRVALAVFFVIFVIGIPVIWWLALNYTRDPARTLHPRHRGPQEGRGALIGARSFSDRLAGALSSSRGSFPAILGISISGATPS